MNMRKELSVLIVLACALAGSLFFSMPQQAQSVIPDSNIESLREQNFAKLIALSERTGSVKVIVGFHFNFTPEGNLTAPLRQNQRANIKQNQDSLLKMLESFKPENVKRFESIPYFAMTADVKTLEFLKTIPEVTFIREDESHAPTLFESAQVVRAPQAWNLGFSGLGQVVAVLDTGVDKNHPFLAGKIVSEACYSTTFAPQGYSSVCPGGVSSSTAPNSGLHCIFSTGCNHGTHVAGIAAGRLTSSGFYGVARDANLVAIQVFSRVDNAPICAQNNNEPSPCVRTWDSDYTAGLQRVLALKQSGVNIASANMSLGGGRKFNYCDVDLPFVKAAVDNLRSVGVATIISSGNDGYTDSIRSPACISSAISVGNSGDGSTCPTAPGHTCPPGNLAILDQVMSGSNSAFFLNLLAPGRWIQSSIPGGGYDTWNGTSMAAPHVAGAWAILNQQNPNATVRQISSALSTTGQPITDSRNGIVKSRINIEAALSTLPCLFPITVGQTINGSLTAADCTFTLSGLTRYVDVYVFDGVAGQQIAVSMNSAIDTHLYLLNSSGQIIALDDDGGGGTNSRIPATSGFFSIPAAGTYSIFATTFDPSTTGSYTLSLVASSYSISGRVARSNGVGVAGVSILLSGSQSGQTTTNSNGDYSINAAGGGNYTITPTLANFTFNPINRTFNNLSSAQTANFTATPTVAFVSVGGRITTPSGRGISGAVLTLTDATGVARIHMTNPFGYFRFPNVRTAEVFTLAVSSKRHSFNPSSRQMTVFDNVTNAGFVSEN